MNSPETWPANVGSIRGIVETKIFRRRQSTLYAHIRPMVCIFRIFGVAPYEFDRSDQLVRSCKFSIFSFFWIMMYTYCYQGLFFRNMKFLLNTTEYVHPSIYLIFTMQFITFASVVFSIIQSLLMRDKLTKIWNALQDYDKAVEDIGHTRNESTTLIWVRSVILFIFLGWLAINQLEIFASEDPWSQVLSSVIVYVGFNVSVIKFSGITMLLGQRFHHLNEITKKSMQDGTRWLYSGPSLVVSKIERLHDDLMTAGENLESMYSSSMIIWIGILTEHVLDCLYNALKSLSVFSEMKKFYCVIAWAIMFSCQLVLLTASCHFASTEANDMISISLEWKRRLYSRYGKVKVMPSVLTTLNRRLRFTASGCFDVNLHLLCTIVGSITTFLVILLQVN